MDIHTEKTIWYHKGNNFTVEICVWRAAKEIALLREHGIATIEYCWNIYAHLFPMHPLFSEVVYKQLFDYGISLPLHWGASYHKWDYDEKGNVIAKRIGCDYQHLHDDRFSKYATKEEAWEVFQDADVLIEFLNLQNTQKGAPCQEGKTQV